MKRSLAILFTFTFAYGATAQSALELNRTGRWAEAADLAATLVADENVPLIKRCEAYASLIYADVRLARFENVKEHLSLFDRMCTEAAAGTWVETTIHRLRSELRPIISSTDDDWEVIDDLASLGLDSVALAEHLALCEASAADACLVVYDGRIVQEYYGPHYREPMMAMSSTKSVTGLLAGMLMAEGKLSLDDSVADFVPEWKAGAKAGVTVRHLLTMTSGLLSSHVRRPAASHVGGVTDKEALVFSLPLVAQPGEVWAYSNEGTFLLSPLLDRAAGEPVEDYAARRLFGPVGMRHTRLHVYPEGQAWTHADMETTPRDLARIGQVMLQGGRWNGKQVVPETWVEASVRPSQSLRLDYGLLWWLDVPAGYAARGYLDTNLYVLPALDLVIVRMQGRPVEGAAAYDGAALDLFRRFVLE